MQNMKKYKLASLLITSLVAFSACSDTSNTYDNGKLAITFNNNWNIIQEIPSDVMQQNPSLKNIVVILNHENAQITIAKKEFKQEIEHEEFVRQNVESLQKLPNFKELNTRNIKLNGKKTEIITFSSDALFMQTYTSDASTAYVITGIMALGANSKLQSEVLNTMRSIKFVAQKDQ